MEFLVVEDEIIVAMEIQDRLENLGYDVSAVVSTGKEAIQKAEETRPDLVLMDIMLKGDMDGIKAAEQIRARFDIPLVYLTAYSDNDTLQRAKVTEPFGYILKPFEERELHTTIEMALYRHKMERRLKESERLLATTLKSIGDAVIATDKKGCVVFMNPVAEALTGWKHEEALGKDLTEVFNIINEETRASEVSAGQNRAATVANPVMRAIREGIVVGLANHSLLIAKDGTEIPIDDSAAPIKDDDGNITGVVLAFQDISERRRAEAEKAKLEEELRQSQKMEAVGQLTAGIAHNFNNMLAAIMGNVELAKMYATDNIQRYLQTAITSSQRAADMVKELMAFSRVGQVEQEPVDIKSVINDTVKICRRTFDRKIEITVESDDNLPPILGNSGKLGQVLLNLCLNARDALNEIDKRLPCIRIESSTVSLDVDDCIIQPEASPGQYIQVSVSDNGIGMDKKTQERIFEPFFTTKEVGKGTGLGLATVYGIIKQHDGWIECQSELGVGTTFSVYLPAYDRNRAFGKNLVSSAEEVERMPGGTETILLIDDEEMIREVAQAMLESRGYTVILGVDGTDGLNAFTRYQDKIDLVILDLSMPKMSGWEVLAEMLAIAPDVKVLISTGHPCGDAKLEGESDVIKKPFQWQEFMQTVREVLEA